MVELVGPTNNKMKNTPYHTTRTAPKTNRKLVERCKIITTNIHLHDHSLSFLCASTSIKSGGVKLVLWIARIREVK